MEKWQSLTVFITVDSLALILLKSAWCGDDDDDDDDDDDR
jgi:hypothetical protein